MGTAEVVIAALAIACLVVLVAIVAVLRSGRRDHPVPTTPAKSVPTTPARSEMPVGELAQRIRDAQPLHLRRASSGPLRADDSTLGRMPDGPAPFERADSAFGVSNGWSMPQYQRTIAGPAQEPRLGSGPLVPLQRGSPLSPLPRYGSDPSGAGAYLSGTSGALGGWTGSWPVSSAAGSSHGRIPGFAVEDTLAAVFGPIPRGLDPALEQRLRDAAYIYDDGIRVSFDPQLDAVDLVFAACPLESEQEVALAFHMLNERLLTLLCSIGRERAALVVDVAGLSIGAEVTETWIQALRQFLLTRCSQAGAGLLLLARYNSRIRAAMDVRASLQRIATTTVTAALNSQTQIFGSRQEAAALITRLRELATVTG